MVLAAAGTCPGAEPTFRFMFRIVSATYICLCLCVYVYMSMFHACVSYLRFMFMFRIYVVIHVYMSMFMCLCLCVYVSCLCVVFITIREHINVCYHVPVHFFRHNQTKTKTEPITTTRTNNTLAGK